MREQALPGESLLCTLPKRERNQEILALSDLSGNPAPFAHALSHTEYATMEDENVIATEHGKKSQVVLAGDLNDRTPHYPALVKLIQDVRGAGIPLTALYGNHDVAALATVSEAPTVSGDSDFPPVYNVCFNIRKNDFDETLASVRDEYKRMIKKIVPSDDERMWLNQRSYDVDIPGCGEITPYKDGILALRRQIQDKHSAYAALFSSMQPAVMLDDVLVVHAGISREWLNIAVQDGIDAANAEWKRAIQDPTALYRMAFGTANTQNGTCYGTKYPELANMIWARSSAVMDGTNDLGWFLDAQTCKNLHALGVAAIVRGHDPTFTRRQLALKHEGIAIVNIEAKLHKHSHGYTRITRGGNVFAYPPEY